MAKKINWVWNYMPKNHAGGGGDSNADESERPHEHRKPQLANDLILLSLGIASKICDIQSQSGPRTYINSKGRKEQSPEARYTRTNLKMIGEERSREKVEKRQTAESSCQLIFF